MIIDHILPHSWKIIEDEYNPNRVEAAESIFSLGNGAMGPTLKNNTLALHFKAVMLLVFTTLTKQK